MSDPSIVVAPQLPALITDAAAEVQSFVRFLLTAQSLTPAQSTLVARYAALSAERQQLVDDLVRELGKLP
jgi:hypothetical protein